MAVSRSVRARCSDSRAVRAKPIETAIAATPAAAAKSPEAIRARCRRPLRRDRAHQRDSPPSPQPRESRETPRPVPSSAEVPRRGAARRGDCDSTLRSKAPRPSGGSSSSLRKSRWASRSVSTSSGRAADWAADSRPVSGAASLMAPRRRDPGVDWDRGRRRARCGRSTSRNRPCADRDRAPRRPARR